MPRLFGDTILRALDANGEPVSGARLRIYEAGTTTPVTIYTDSALSVTAAQPVAADSSGVFAPLYVASGYYKISVQTVENADLPGSPIDNIAAGVTDAVALGASLITSTGGTRSRALADKLADVLGVLDFTGADPTGATDSRAAFVEAHAALPAGFPLWVGAGTYQLSSDLDMQGRNVLLLGATFTGAGRLTNARVFEFGDDKFSAYNGAGGDYIRIGTNGPNAGLNARGLQIGGAETRYGTDGIYWGTDGIPAVLRAQPTANYSPAEMVLYGTAAQPVVSAVAAGNTITRNSGSSFDAAWIGRLIYVSGGKYRVSAVASADSMTVTNPNGSTASLPALTSVLAIVAFHQASGTCSVSGTTVTHIDGPRFPIFFTGTDFELLIGGTAYTVSAATATTYTLTTAPGDTASTTWRARYVIDDTITQFRVQGPIGPGTESNLTLGWKEAEAFLRTQADTTNLNKALVLEAGVTNRQLDLRPSGEVRVGRAPNAGTPRINWFEFLGAEAGTRPSLRMRGTDTNVGLSLDMQGTGASFVLTDDSFGRTIFLAAHGVMRVTTALPTYADDAAAGVGGLAAGDVYKTAAGALMVKL